LTKTKFSQHLCPNCGGKDRAIIITGGNLFSVVCNLCGYETPKYEFLIAAEAFWVTESMKRFGGLKNDPAV